MFSYFTTRFLPVAAVGALVLLRSESAAGQQPHCRSDVRREAHPYAYQTRGDRCEGSCGRLTSNTTALRVVGFSRGPALPPADPPATLFLRWAPPADAGLVLRVSAVAGPHCYQMDTEQPPHASRFSWSSRLLRAIGVRPEHLAAVVWTSHPVGGRMRSVIVPVEPDRHRAPDEALVVDLVPAREFQKITFTLTRPSDGAVIIADRSLGEPYYPEDEVVRMRLPPGLPAGAPLRLRVVGTYEGGSNSTEVLLWIPR